MFACLRISVPFGKAEVNNINVMLPFINSNKKVVRLDVPVNKQPRVNVLNSLDLK